MSIEIKLTHERTRQTHGPERLQAELADHGIHAGVDRIKQTRRDVLLETRGKISNERSAAPENPY